MYEFAVDLVRNSRPAQAKTDEFIGQMVTWGAGPRASIFLLLAAKARALLQGRFHTTTDDVCVMALPVLRHRLIPSFNAEASGQTADQIILRLVEQARNDQRSSPTSRSATRPGPGLKVTRDNQIPTLRK